MKLLFAIVMLAAAALPAVSLTQHNRPPTSARLPEGGDVHVPLDASMKLSVSLPQR